MDPDHPGRYLPESGLLHRVGSPLLVLVRTGLPGKDATAMPIAHWPALWTRCGARMQARASAGAQCCRA